MSHSSVRPVTVIAVQEAESQNQKANSIKAPSHANWKMSLKHDSSSFPPIQSSTNPIERRTIHWCLWCARRFHLHAFLPFLLLFLPSRMEIWKSKSEIEFSDMDFGLWCSSERSRMIHKDLLTHRYKTCRMNVKQDLGKRNENELVRRGRSLWRCSPLTLLTLHTGKLYVLINQRKV